jgi:hypothetical protein
MSVVPKDDVLINLLAGLRRTGSGSGLQNTHIAFEVMAKAVQTKWQMTVGSKYKIEKPKRIDPFTIRVESEEKMVHWLEYGLPAYDMRQTHTSGAKSRVVKPKYGAGGKLITQWKVKNPDGTYRMVVAGSRYAIIPFFHDTKTKSEEGAQKTLGDVYNNVRKQVKTEGFKRSSVTKSPADSNTQSPNAMGEMVKRAEYDWGSRVEFPDEPEYDNLQGMVVMNSPKQSSYMTFRVVSTNSPASSWQHPGIEARHHLKKILEEGQEQIRNVLREALGRDFGSNII